MTMEIRIFVHRPNEELLNDDECQYSEKVLTQLHKLVIKMQSFHHSISSGNFKILFFSLQFVSTICIVLITSCKICKFSIFDMERENRSGPNCLCYIHRHSVSSNGSEFVRLNKNGPTLLCNAIPYGFFTKDTGRDQRNPLLNLKQQYYQFRRFWNCLHPSIIQQRCV